MNIKVDDKLYKCFKNDEHTFDKEKYDYYVLKKYNDKYEFEEKFEEKFEQIENKLPVYDCVSKVVIDDVTINKIKTSTLNLNEVLKRMFDKGLSTYNETKIFLISGVYSSSQNVINKLKDFNNPVVIHTDEKIEYGCEFDDIKTYISQDATVVKFKNQGSTALCASLSLYLALYVIDDINNVNTAKLNAKINEGKKIFSEHDDYSCSEKIKNIFHKKNMLNNYKINGMRMVVKKINLNLNLLTKESFLHEFKEDYILMITKTVLGVSNGRNFVIGHKNNQYFMLDTHSIINIKDYQKIDDHKSNPDENTALYVKTTNKDILYCFVNYYIGLELDNYQYEITELTKNT